MLSEQTERRVTNPASRKSRVLLGTGSAPVATIICYVLFDILGKPVSTELVIAISSLTASLVTVMALCFNDMRGIILSRFLRRRARDNGRGRA